MVQTNIQLLDCPFCGCKMSERDGYFIYGDHADDCFFTLADNQHTIDFFEKDNLIGLHNAWNKRKVRHPSDKRYQVKLCYGYEQNEDGSIFHAFEAISTDECPVEKEVGKSLRETLEADEDDFDWDWMFISLPEQTVRQIRGDALEEITLAMAKMTATHEQDKLALLKIIASLGEKLSAAEACIDEIEDHLNRGSDNDWAQDAIARYQKFVEEQNANK